MVAKEWLKGANLHPSSAHLRRRVAKEAANISANLRKKLIKN